MNYTKDELQELARLKSLTPIDRLVHWIRERESIRLKKEAGKSKPWTTDPILLRYRFCNVQREYDKVTVWIKDNWREPYKDDPNVWFAMVVARLINWPDTLEEIGIHCVVKGAIVWNKSEFINRMNARQNRKEKLFTGAYMIHADSTHGGTKAEYLAEMVLGPLWKDRTRFARHFDSNSPTLGNTFGLLREYRDMGEFMSGQIIADIKYTPILSNAIDWWTWATPGPGSRRGLSRLLERPVTYKWHPTEWLEEATKVYNEIKPKIGIKLHMQDINNTLCELDKHSRVLFGEGEPRSRYLGAK